jgi:cell division protein FtsW
MRYKHTLTSKRISNSKKLEINATVYGYRLLIVAAILSIIGLFALLNVSLPTAMREFNDKYYFVKEQAKWILLGLFVMVAFSYMPLQLVKKYAFYVWIANIVLLFLVLLPGFGVKVLGASRWLLLGPIQIQPAEFMKLSIVLYLAVYTAKKGLLPIKNFLVIVGLSVFPILLQPDMGTAIVICLLSIAVYFITGPRFRSVVGLFVSFFTLSLLFALAAPYRFARITGYINPFSDPLNATYHIRQVLIALGSGGLFGVGLGKSIQKYAYIPEITTDSIFSVIGEEIGFVGASVLLFCFMVLLYYGFKIVFLQKTVFTKTLSFGLITILGIQIAINIAAMVSLIPLTGIPLPFISYGGSHFILSSIIIGLLVSSAKNKQKT